MTVSDLDHFIISLVGANWQKIAMVVARVLTDPDLDFPETSDDAEFVVSRVQELILRGQLEAQGNTSDLRHSEVRRSIADSGAA